MALCALGSQNLVHMLLSRDNAIYLNFNFVRWAKLPKIAKNGQIKYKRVFLVLYALGTYNLVCRSQKEYRLRYKTFDLIRWAKLPKISKSHISVFLSFYIRYEVLI